MFSDPSQFLLKLAIFAPPMLMAVTIHEVSHGAMAALLGDPTARLAGRLTLNPLKHLDPLGLLVFIVTRMFGWAKPVPVNPQYFKNPRQGMALVGMAGPIANFAMATLSALALRGMVQICPASAGAGFGDSVCTPLGLMLWVSVQVNLALGIFNLLPIPPLDGGHLLMSVLPRNLAHTLAGKARWGFLLVVLLVLLGAFDRVFGPVLDALSGMLASPSIWDWLFLHSQILRG